MSAVLKNADSEPKWFLVSQDGSSATRILPGLSIGETDQGVITLGGRMSQSPPLLRFDTVEDDGSWLELTSPAHRMVTREGASIQRERVSAGLVLVLPKNRLIITPDIGDYQPSGHLIEVTTAAARRPQPIIRTPKRQPHRRRKSKRGLGLVILLLAAPAALAGVLSLLSLPSDVASDHYASIMTMIRAYIAEILNHLSIAAIAIPYVR
jgi:hypothetical protein